VAITTSPLRIGAAGVGGFGQFVLEALEAVPDVKLTAVYDADPARARSVADRYGAVVCDSLEDLVGQSTVDVVYAAAPPAAHGPAVLAALRNGKHVWVEKPLATSRDEVAAICRQAASAGLRVGIDYVLRFNPLYRWAAELGRSGLLGKLRHMTLENDAADERLPAEHWFWKPEVSGTILVEHGVHFFDIAAELAGAEGQMEYCEAWVRPPYGFTDRVLAVTRFGDVPAVFYHAFDKPDRVERTAFRLAYDLGYVTVEGWMPTAVQVEAYVDDEGLSRLEEVLHAGELPMGAGYSAPVQVSLDVVESYRGAGGAMKGRGVDRKVTHFVRLHISCPEGKQAIYARTVQAGMADFARSIREAGYAAEVTLEQAARSVGLALDAVDRTILRT